jgi:hypothetical protein
VKTKTPNIMTRAKFQDTAGTVAPMSANRVEVSSATQPRHLNDAIKDDLQRMIHDNDIQKVYIQSVWGDTESKQFAAEIEEYLKQARLEVDGAPGAPKRSEKGIGVAIKGQAAYLTVGSNKN